MIITCPRCQQPLECPPELSGQVVACPRCQLSIALPAIEPIVSVATYKPKTRDESNDWTGFAIATAFMALVVGTIVYWSSTSPTQPTQRPLSNHPGILQSLNTITLLRVVERLPDYEPLDAGFQEPKDSKAVWLGGDKYRVTGTIRTEGKRSHSFVAEIKFQPGGKEVFTSIVIDGKQRL